MDFETKPLPKKVICIAEGIYSGALTFGKMYEVITWDGQKQQVKVQGDNGRTRWYSCGCFDVTGGEVPQLTRILRVDPLENPVGWTEVEMELSNGQRRWCYFITPELLSQQREEFTFGSARLLSYNAPHMIVVSALSKEMIEQTLKYIKCQVQMLDCTKLIE